MKNLNFKFASSKLKVGLFFMILVGALESFACSIQVDDNYMKNQLMAHGVSFNDLSLSVVSGLSISAYGKSLSGGGGGGSCPDYMIVSGRVSLEHSPAANQHCSYAVTVNVRSYMGEEIPDGPIEEVTFESPVAACSTSLSRVKIPVKLRVKPKKKIIIRRFE